MHTMGMNRLLRPLHAGNSTLRTTALITAITAWLLVAGPARADGCFVFVWNKQKDINEPTQKAILLHDQGREDLVLQVKYEGPAEDFGWLVPVPGLPEVRKGSMECFYELSRLTQERWPDRLDQSGASLGAMGEKGEPATVKVIEIKTVGAYEVAVLSSGNAASLAEWLEANHFVFPKDKQGLLDSYVQKHWYFVAVRINPEGSGFALKSAPQKRAAIAPSTRSKLASGELHPLVLSFPSAKCVFPLAISAVNGKPSDVSLYVLSAEPLMSRVIFEKKFEAWRRERAQWLQGRPEREKQRRQAYERMQALSASAARFPGGADPDDPAPSPAVMGQLLAGPYEETSLEPMEEEYYGGRDLLRSMEVEANELRASVKELPRLAGKSWWLTKQVQTFSPAEMRDLEFESAVICLAEKLPEPDGQAPALSLAQFGARAIPVILAGLTNSDPAQRSLALSILPEAEMFRRVSYLDKLVDEPSREPSDSHIAAVLPSLLADKDASVRGRACEAAARHWDAALVPRLTELLGDGDASVRSAACSALQENLQDAAAQLPVLRKMLEEDGPAAPYAIGLVMRQEHGLPKELLPRLLCSTNPRVVMVAAAELRSQNPDLAQLAPLLTNSLPMVRLTGLAALTRMGDKPAVERIVSMLRDPNEAVRWRVRSSLRQLSGQKLGADRTAWEQWWTTNKETFTPQRPSRPPW